MGGEGMLSVAEASVPTMATGATLLDALPCVIPRAAATAVAMSLLEDPRQHHRGHGRAVTLATVAVAGGTSPSSGKGQGQVAGKVSLAPVATSSASGASGVGGSLSTLVEATSCPSESSSPRSVVVVEVEVHQPAEPQEWPCHCGGVGVPCPCTWFDDWAP